MKVLAISDLHSNLPALRAVFREQRRKRTDLLVCLGDFVGYGAQPNQVLELYRGFRSRKLAIRGNHDRVCATAAPPLGFNSMAREAVLWTRSRLTPAGRRFLAALPEGPLIERDLALCHGSPGDEDEYLFTPEAAEGAFAASRAWVTLFGHTHLPAVFELSPDGRVQGMTLRDEAMLTLDRRHRYLINPGSVGQPRDRNSAASYAQIDLEKGTVRFRRVVYDIAAAQRAILGAGLPSLLAERLSGGY